MTENEAREKAKRFLSDPEYNIEDIKAVVDILKGAFEFKLSRRLLKRACQRNPDSIWCKQQLALCTYKDEELPPAERFAEAIKILEGINLRDASNKNSETLSLGGAIYKRLWEYNGQIDNLFEALSFYRSAFERDSQQDTGYGGVNAAYILDLLAHQAYISAFHAQADPLEAEIFRERADLLRERIVKELEELYKNDQSLKENGFFLATLAEAYLGLKSYEKADEWLIRWRNLFLPEWERQTIFKQLVSIVRLQNIERPKEGQKPERWHKAWQVISNVTGKWSENAFCSSLNRVGLALSGGGFRASLFHLGVLARLAEVDALRNIEVISAVSGGSIVGAHYYLELKNLLETKKDEEIKRQDYLDLVKRLQKSFLQGIQQNIHTRTITNIGKDLKMIFSKDYSRTHRIGELYEEILYACVEDNHPKGSPRYIKDLLIQPKGEEDRFNPKFSNWHRRAKVPVLLINATSLNTGHAWQFTARSMGEPPGLLGAEIDKNSLYRRFWYEEAPHDNIKNFRLGYAVAASACVPGLFEPLALSGVYPKRIVRLVEGGLYDNQGIKGLLDDACNFIFCSDASGQVEDSHRPSNGIFSVLFRSNSILMDRIRESGYQDIQSRYKSHAIRGIFFVHLKKDLKVNLLDWIRCEDKIPESETEDHWPPYGIDPECQRLLSDIRTDLDAFSEVEAYALMCSGYLMTEEHLMKLQNAYKKRGGQDTWGGLNIDAPREKWEFLEMECFLKKYNKSKYVRRDVIKQLRVGSSKAFKIWHLDWRLKFFLFLLLLSAGYLIYYAALNIGPYLSKPLFTFTLTVYGIIYIMGAVLLFSVLMMIKIALPEKFDISNLYKIFIICPGFIVANIHILVFNRMFLKRGKIGRLMKKHVKFLVKEKKKAFYRKAKTL